jgi:hypothetical protein
MTVLLPKLYLPVHLYRNRLRVKSTTQIDFEQSEVDLAWETAAWLHIEQETQSKRNFQSVLNFSYIWVLFIDLVDF